MCLPVSVTSVGAAILFWWEVLVGYWAVAAGLDYPLPQLTNAAYPAVQRTGLQLVN